MRRRAQVEEPNPLTLEERLHQAHDAFMFIGDLLELLAIGPDYVRGDMPSAAGCQAAAALCRERASNLRQTLDVLPPSLSSWPGD
jgi:hypothetical protein